MNDSHPTYNLPPDFRVKLRRYVQTLLSDGLSHFADEFEKIDSFASNAAEEFEATSAYDLQRNPPEKYLMELITFQIYDQLNRELFNSSKDTLIVMPDCLSLDNLECEKVETKIGDVCKRCRQACKAYQVTELARRYKAKVIFSRKKLSEQLEHFAGRMNNPGVIGIACIMMLAIGMRTAADVGLPARGVLLSCSGCDHWNHQPFESRFPLEWLSEILEEKHGSRVAASDH